MKFPIKDFFIKCDQIRRKFRLWSHLLEISFFVQCSPIDLLDKHSVVIV